MSIWFRSVKKYYEMGLYTKDNVKVFVRAKFINADEYKIITGDEYVE